MLNIGGGICLTKEVKADGVTVLLQYLLVHWNGNKLLFMIHQIKEYEEPFGIQKQQKHQLALCRTPTLFSQQTPPSLFAIFLKSCSYSSQTSSVGGWTIGSHIMCHMCMNCHWTTLRIKLGWLVAGHTIHRVLLQCQIVTSLRKDQGQRRPADQNGE